MKRIGIDTMTGLGMPPLEYVRLAAELGCGSVSTGLMQFPVNPHNYPAWSLKDDPPLRREMKAVMKDLGIRIAGGDGFRVRPDGDVRERGAELDLMVELGAHHINVVSMETDRSRSLDQVAALAELVDARGMGLMIEFAPPNAINTMASALEYIRHVNKPMCKMLIDSMHFFRSGATIAELKAVDPKLIGYAQLCDVPLVSKTGDYMKEAMLNRLPPGDGELPLADLLAALPPGLDLGVEVPMLAQAEAGVEARVYIGRAVKASQDLVKRVCGG